MAVSFQIWPDLVRFGQDDPANHISANHSLDQSHEGLQAPRGPETGFKDRSVGHVMLLGHGGVFLASVLRAI